MLFRFSNNKQIHMQYHEGHTLLVGKSSRPIQRQLKTLCFTFKVASFSIYLQTISKVSTSEFFCEYQLVLFQTLKSNTIVE